MRNLLKWIEANGGLARLKDNPLRVPARDGLMCLTVEGIGLGPHGLSALSVAHYYEQEGDLMQDPEMMFEAGPDGKLYPYAFQQASPPIYREVYACDETGKVTGIRLKLKHELESFAREWDRNLKEQEFFQDAATGEAHP